jgi:hypothetical protein
VKGELAALLEFGLPYDQTVCCDVLEPECQRFGDSYAGCRKKAEEGRVHQRPDRACRLQPGCGPYQSDDLIRPINVGSSPFEPAMPQGVGRGHLMAGILGLHRLGKAPDREKPVAALRRRRRPCGPIEHAVDADELVPLRLGEGHEVPEQRLLDAESEAQGAVQVHVSCQVLAQHDAPPGQTCAICRSMATSTLA